MQLKLFSICDGAFNNGGRLTIVNTLDVIHTKNLPLAMSLGVAMTLIFNEEDEGRHRIELHIENASNKVQIAKMESEVIVPKDKDGGFLNFASNVNGFTFKEAASYSFNLFVDGIQLGVITIPVKKVE